MPLPTGPITMMVGRISVANPARAVKLHFTDASMVGYTVTVRHTGIWLGRYTNIALGDFTQWMPSTELQLDVSGCAGGGSTSAPTVGVLRDLGGFVSTAHSEASSKPYPAAGQHFTLTLGQPSYIGFDSAAVASCDKLEARDAAGQSLWQWEPGVTLFGDTPVVTDTKGFTSKLQGTVDFGIWGNGCNATEAKAGFRVTQVLSEEPFKSGPPVTMTLPGQKLRYDGTVDNWYRHYQPELGRYLTPEAWLLKPEWSVTVALTGWSTRSYSYAQDVPLSVIDPSGLYSWRMECSTGDELGIMPGGLVLTRFQSPVAHRLAIQTNTGYVGFDTASHDFCADCEEARRLAHSIKSDNSRPDLQVTFASVEGCWRALVNQICSQCKCKQKSTEKTSESAYAGR